MEDQSILPRGFLGCILLIISVPLTIMAMVVSVVYTHPEPTTNIQVCAGYPMIFICDRAGGSPISGWGKIQFSDVIEGGIVPGGFLISFTFYTLIFALLFLLVFGIFRLIDRLLG